jgi:hypothetical protein
VKNEIGVNGPQATAEEVSPIAAAAAEDLFYVFLFMRLPLCGLRVRQMRETAAATGGSEVFFLPPRVYRRDLFATKDLVGTGKIIKSIISRTLNSNVICSYLHESYNLESNKLILKVIIFNYSSENRSSLMKVIIFRLFSVFRKLPK